MAVGTNCALVFFTSTFSANMSVAGRISGFFIAEHVLVALKAIIILRFQVFRSAPMRAIDVVEAVVVV